MVCRKDRLWYRVGDLDREVQSVDVELAAEQLDALSVVDVQYCKRVRVRVWLRVQKADGEQVQLREAEAPGQWAKY